MRKGQSAKERLVALGELNGKKGKEYGPFEKIGKVLEAFFPEGMTLKGQEQFTKFVLFSLVSLKMDRLSNYVPGDLHEDSMDDAAVYLMMLRSFDESGHT